MMDWMSDQGGVPSRRRGDVPPLAAEDCVCQTCGVEFARFSVADAVAAIGSLPGRVREAVSAAPADVRRLRPSDDRWSVIEYVCHLRDVYAIYTVRLHRARTEHEPVLEPMLNDLRARRFRYSERDVDAVLDELSATAAGFCEEVARMDQWERLVERLPGEYRSARWLVRQAMHEGQHHLGDIHWTTSAVTLED